MRWQYTFSFVTGSFPQPDFSTPDSGHSPYSTLSPLRHRTLADSLDALEASPAKFSLASPTKSDDFNCEEAELKDIVNNANRMFPQDLSFGRCFKQLKKKMVRKKDVFRKCVLSICTKLLHSRIKRSLLLKTIKEIYIIRNMRLSPNRVL